MKQQTVRRHELKYYISRTDYERYRVILGACMHRDPYQTSEDGYLVRSLYFDTPYDRSLQEKLSGIEHRDKYRLRVYAPDQSWVKLERKRKVNQYVKKDSYIMQKQDALQLIQHDTSVLLSSENPTAQLLGVEFEEKAMRPVVLIDYQRDAFLLDYNEIRITFDKHLKTHGHSSDLFTHDPPTHNALRDDTVIMEVKYNHFLPSWLSNLLHGLSPTHSAISKYTYGRLAGADSGLLTYLS